MTTAVAPVGDRTSGARGGHQRAMVLLRRARLGSVILFAIAGCAHGDGKSGARADGRPTKRGAAGVDGAIEIGPEATSHGKDVLGAWLAYGVGRSAAYKTSPPPAANQSADDYALEFVARQIQSEFWEKARGQGAAPYPLLDRQVEIWRAGFLPELLVAIYAHPGWTVPGATLKGLRLEAFGKRFSGTYDTKLAVVLVSPAGKKFPEVPGGDFPDPATLPIHPDSCGRRREERAAAWRRWDTLAPRLGGVPVAAEDSVKFAGALNRVTGDPRYLARGVTWVSWRVGHLAYLDGFCAMEAKDWSRAAEALGRAVALTPTEVGPRLELGMALALTKHYDEAIVQDRAIIEHTDDACAVAAALRHEGFAYFDMGMLESARLAYQKSLEYDPQSAIATTELRGIGAALAMRHDSPKDAARFVPPPASLSVLTKCAAPAP